MENHVKAPARPPVVLVVEDEAAVATLLRLALEAKGYTVLMCSDGDKALKFLREHGDAIDVLLTDVMLPHIHGLDLITLVEGQWPNIKIILCSGQLSEAELAQTGSAFLPKPFTTQDLYTVLDAVIYSPPR
jgi:two-component system, cell cycle sensor histidine kinase and response regulator CckA